MFKGETILFILLLNENYGASYLLCNALLVFRLLKETCSRENPQMGNNGKIILLLFYGKLYGDLALHSFFQLSFKACFRVFVILWKVRVKRESKRNSSSNLYPSPTF